MSSTMNANEGYLPGIERLQFFTLADGDQPVFGTMKYVGMTVYFPDPLICLKLVTQNISHWQNGKKSLYRLSKTVVGCIQDEVPWLVFTCQFHRETTPKASSIQDDMIFVVLLHQGFIHKLHIFQHIPFTSFTGAFSKPPVIDHHNIVSIAIKILRIF